MSFIKLTKSAIPNSITALNILCGFISIVLASEGEFQLSAIFILGAALFDLCDGIAARLLKTSSLFGVELDSLSDIVSFGAAPSFLIYKVYLFQFGIYGIFVSSLPLIFGAFRLARFNVQIDDIDNKHDFSGLPIPMSAITIATLIIGFLKNDSLNEAAQLIAVPLIIILSLLMVSKIKYDSFPKLSSNSIQSRIIILFFLSIGIILVFITAGIALFYIFVGFVLFGIVRQLYSLIFLHKHENEIQINENK